MEHLVDDIPFGVFGAVPNLSRIIELVISPEELSEAPDILLLEDEVVGWRFFKGSDDEQAAATAKFAERWARQMQLYLTKGISIHDSWRISALSARDDHLSSAMAHQAVRLLTRHWVYGSDLLKAYQAYQKHEGNEIQRAQLEQLEDHLT
jgi:hypothetical protein